MGSTMLTVRRGGAGLPRRFRKRYGRIRRGGGKTTELRYQKYTEVVLSAEGADLEVGPGVYVILGSRKQKSLPRGRWAASTVPVPVKVQHGPYRPKTTPLGPCRAHSLKTLQVTPGSRYRCAKST